MVLFIFIYQKYFFFSFHMMHSVVFYLILLSAFIRWTMCSCCHLVADRLHFSLVIHKNGPQSKAACSVILELLTRHSFPFIRLTVWTAMPTLALLPHLQPHSSHLPKLPLPHLLEVQCLRGQWLASAAMLHLRQLYLEPMLLRLPLALHLLPSQPVPPTLQHARCRPLRPLSPR